MPHNRETEYPGGLFEELGLTNTPVDVGTPGVDLKINAMRFRGGAAAENIILRNSTGSVVYFNLPIGILEYIQIPRGWQTTGGGLEVLTLTAAGDVRVWMEYFQP